MNIVAHVLPQLPAYCSTVPSFGRPNNNNLTPFDTVWLPKLAILRGNTMAATIDGSEIARLLAEDVHSGILQPGDMIPSERDLCARFGVGRTVVRDAVTTLEAMKLIV